MCEMPTSSRTKQVAALAMVLLTLLAPRVTADEGIFEVGPLTAHRGESTSGMLPVPDGGDGGTHIPVTLIHGAHPGPVLALIAGTHGYEYPPILALQRVRRKLDPERLRGSVILVHVANLPSFLGRTVYYSPVDGKNLNRVYPGRADGTLSERIADTIYRQVIRQADVLIDMHGGDGNEALRPYVYTTVTGDPETDRRSRDLATVFGLDTIVVERDWSPDPSAHVYTEWAARGLGKPAISTETGGLGSSAQELVLLAERGVWNVLRHLRMVDGEPEVASAVTWLEGGRVVRSPTEGVFQPAVEPGWTVAAGGRLGTLFDFFGDPVEDITAPFAGVVNYVVATPPVSEGEPLAMVSRVAAGPPGP
jgi:predicted deacylase